MFNFLKIENLILLILKNFYPNWFGLILFFNFDVFFKLIFITMLDLIFNLKCLGLEIENFKVKNAQPWKLISLLLRLKIYEKKFKFKHFLFLYDLNVSCYFPKYYPLLHHCKEILVLCWWAFSLCCIYFWSIFVETKYTHRQVQATIWPTDHNALENKDSSELKSLVSNRAKSAQTPKIA